MLIPDDGVVWRTRNGKETIVSLRRVVEEGGNDGSYDKVSDSCSNS
jgi:hypothetical protein